MSSTVLEKLAAEYPQLYLDPDVDSQEAFRQVILQGKEPEIKRLSHYQGDVFDKQELVDPGTGPVRVVTLGNRHDFELVMRSLMAAKTDPRAPIPESQGASMLTVFNWPRIHAHLRQFPEAEQAAEFKRFTAVKEIYIDRLIVLSLGPYSHIDASKIGCENEEWLRLSDTIRRYHELTHVICRIRYPEDVDAVRDELIADAVGLYAAYGAFDPEKERLFLGIEGRRYVGGRLGNYTDDPDSLAPTVSDRIDEMKRIIDKQKPQDPFNRIPLLM
ncbi:MAG: hypothetical protein IJ174_08700, partial [Clostridia bacterium]|nr:hypothetical protein [Clostridia bacterium]